MADIGEVWQNGYAGRLIRLIKEEEADLSEYEAYHDALPQLGRLLDDVYMHMRIHSALGYLTPSNSSRTGVPSRLPRVLSKKRVFVSSFWGAAISP